jgi:hypothetical protein
MFAHEIPVRIGETLTRDGFLFTDLTPGPVQPVPSTE